MAVKNENIQDLNISEEKLKEEDLNKTSGGRYGYWQCPKCTQYNSYSNIKCSNCGRPQ